MNQHKKIGFLLFILITLISCCTITAFATDGTQGVTAEQVQQILDSQAAASKAAEAKATAAKEAAAKALLSSANYSSKSTISRVGSGYSSSDTVSGGSSDGSSGISSDLSSSEASSELVLPSVNSIQENNPLSSLIVDSAANRSMNWWGLLSWACIAIGMIIILIVVFSNRRPPRGGPGRKRYRRPSHTHKKRLLNDKYYRNMKF
jgi:cobalamin biosynthesis Mg chelatase CobN